MHRVLIVDDSPTARELIAGILNSDAECEVIGQAANGFEAVQMTQELRPDIVTMDVHMPGLNGLDATEEIMSTCPTPIVIVSASTMVKDVEWALGALHRGALTLLLKPPGPASAGHNAAAKELLETVKAMAAVKVVRRRHRTTVPAPPVQLQSLRPRGARTFAIATSTGGPPAIKQILSCLPIEFSDPILIVQHIAKGFTDGFVAWLDSEISLPVKVGQQSEPLKGGVVYIAPENQHMGVTRDRRVLLSDDQPIGGFRPSATYLFRSVAEACKQNAVGLILTGMGNDGVAGLHAVRSSGGYVIAQNEATSVIFGMPGAAIEGGVVDVTLPLDQICPAILQLSSVAGQS